MTNFKYVIPFLFIIFLSVFLINKKEIVEVEGYKNDVVIVDVESKTEKPVVINNIASSKIDLINKDSVLKKTSEIKPIQSVELVVKNKLQLFTEGMTTIESVDDAFISNDGVVSKNGLEVAFSQGGFKSISEKFNNITETELSIERETALVESINQNFGNKIYNTYYSCRGKICLVAFDYTDIKELELKQLSKFKSNYSFYNVTSAESNINTFKAMYIKADDPSSLTINNG